MKWLYLVCFIVLSLSIPASFKRLTQGFRIAKMHDEIPYESVWETKSPLSQQEVVSILDQPFTYLNKGAQCYAFLSEDGHYVLKLFRFDRHQNLIRNWVGACLNKPSEQPAPLEKRKQFFYAAKLAQERAAEETATLYLHLNCTEGQLPLLSARAPLGQRLSLPLDHYRFVIQKKAVLLEEAFLEAREKGVLPKRLEALFTLLMHRIDKGIGNRDSNLWRNFGMIGDRAVEFDFGCYGLRPDFDQKEARVREFTRYMHPLRIWLQKNAPECLSLCDAQEERLR
ncbi:MAG: hypothetical protein HY861_01980 [Chlamydiia bacterium]|nr:hypothetical protein [Chlamydiia bacterium]